MKFFKEITAILTFKDGSYCHPVCKDFERVKGSCYKEISKEIFFETIKSIENKYLGGGK